MRAQRPALILLALVLGTSVVVRAAVPGPASDPAGLKGEIAASRLEPARAVAVKNVSLNAGLARFELQDGVLVPASAVGGKSIEMVFLGSGRITVEPPDDVEAGQLELFTGARKLDEEFREAVLVVGLDAAAGALLKRPPAALTSELAKRGAEVYAKWKGSHERKELHVDGGLLINASGDPLYQGFFAGWFRGRTLGDFLYLIEPDAREQVTLGHFVPLDASEKEKRKLLRTIHREQRHGRLIGVELEDLGQWDTWLSASLRGKDGKPRRGTAAFEPRKYTLDVSLSDRAETLTGKARIDLEPVLAGAGARAVNLRLDPDLEVKRVTDGAGADLAFLRTGSDLTALLPRPPRAGEAATLVVEYAGKIIAKDYRSFELLDTQNWYPHTGSRDRALYDVTFHWPHRLDLLACGRRVAGGEGDGVTWERRTLDVPVAGFAFEVGHFRTEKLRAGHIEVTLAFDPDAAKMSSKVREEIGRSVTDSLAYFEGLFGPLPLDQLTVVTVPRDFSQSMFGFVTLSDAMMVDLGFWNLLLGLEDRRTIVAHEIAHQWWGHLVGWDSYRDQWISEAMANYAAVLYDKNRLRDPAFHFGPTSGWQRELTRATADGRPLESLGPVVLGDRLLSSKSSDAYQAIVYQKGAVILDMLARTVGEDDFPRVLREIVRVVDRGAISTEDFLALITRISGLDLGWFAERYVSGTGLAEVYYTYRFEREPGEPGKPAKPDAWRVTGTARQHAPYRFRYRVVKAPAGSLDVARDRLEQVPVAGSLLVVPVEVAIYDPTRPPAKGRGKEHASNATASAHIVLRGEASDFKLKLAQEPKDLWLDRGERVFGRFFNESRNPKRVLFYQGLDAAAAGRAGEAEALFNRALAAEVEIAGEGGSDKRDLKREGRTVDGEISLELARLHLAAGKDAQAEQELDRARGALAGRSGWVAEEQKILDARLALGRGDFDRAFRRLRGGFFSNGVDSTEGYLLLAIAARAGGHREELDQALKAVKDSGADTALLTAN
jgi:hypothetical protein